MSLRMRALAFGPGWSVHEALCDSGPADRPFEERHDTVCIAAVVSGTFQYRSDADPTATLVPGALLLGSHGRCFACSHEHGVGDRCIAFAYEPEMFEAILRDLPGAGGMAFPVATLPPLASSLPLLAAACDCGALEELSLRIAAYAVTQARREPFRRATVSARDGRRISVIVRRIEADPTATVTLSGLARDAGMSPYHCLRVFRAVTGTTPYQFALGLRLRAAASRLARTPASVTEAAFDAGFSDLSEFTRRFRRVFGTTPSAFRKTSAASMLPR